jgi:hypothetical protein
MKSFLSAFAVLLALGASIPAAQNRVLDLQGATLIDGTGRPPVQNAVIVIEGGRIKAVGTRGQVSTPAGAQVINLSGRTAATGAHRRARAPARLPGADVSAYGITTIADIHNDTAWSIAEREALKDGRIKGPRMFVSGARVTGPLGPPTT